MSELDERRRQHHWLTDRERSPAPAGSCQYCGSVNGETPPSAYATDPLTGDNLRAAIAAATDLVNPRLSEVDWDQVAAVFDAPAPADRPEQVVSGLGDARPIALTSPAPAEGHTHLAWDARSVLAPAPAGLDIVEQQRYLAGTSTPREAIDALASAPAPAGLDETGPDLVFSTSPAPDGIDTDCMFLASNRISVHISRRAINAQVARAATRPAEDADHE